MKGLGKELLALAVFFVSILVGAGGGCMVGFFTQGQSRGEDDFGIPLIAGLVGAVVGLILGITMIERMWRRRDE